MSLSEDVADEDSVNDDDDDGFIQNAGDLQRAIRGDEVLPKASDLYFNKGSANFQSSRLDANDINRLQRIAKDGGDGQDENFAAPLDEDDDGSFQDFVMSPELRAEWDSYYDKSSSVFETYGIQDDDKPFLDQSTYLESCRNIQPDGSINIPDEILSQASSASSSSSSPKNPGFPGEERMTDAELDYFMKSQNNERERYSTSNYDYSKNSNQPPPTIEDLIKAQNRYRELDPMEAKSQGDELYRRVFENEQAYLKQSKEFKNGLVDEESSLKELQAKRRAEAYTKEQEEEADALSQKVDAWLEDFDQIQEELVQRRQEEAKQRQREQQERAQREKEEEEELSASNEGGDSGDAKTLADWYASDDAATNDISSTMQSSFETDSGPVAQASSGGQAQPPPSSRGDKDYGGSSRFPSRELFEEASAQVGASRSKPQSMRRRNDKGKPKSGRRAAAAARPSNNRKRRNPTQEDIDKFRRDFMMATTGDTIGQRQQQQQEQANNQQINDKRPNDDDNQSRT